MGLMDGKKGIVFGIANDRSYATFITKSLIEHGATCGFTHLPDPKGKMERRCRMAVEELGIKDPWLVPCDASKDEDLDAVFEKIEKDFGTIDFIVHAHLFAAQSLSDHFEYRFRLGHPPGTLGPAGLPAVVGADELGVGEGLEGGDVFLDDGVSPHVGVHRGGDQQGGLAGQGTGYQRDDVASQAVGEFGDQVGCRGGDDHQFAPAGDADVLAVGVVVTLPDAGEDRLAGQGLEGQRADEMRGGVGHEDTDIGALLDESADQ